MVLIALNPRPEFESNEKLNKKLHSFTKLINELKEKPLSENETATINEGIGDINAFKGSVKDFRKTLTKSQSNILKVIEKESKLVVKNHYRNLWMAVGMSVFGIPFGLVFGTVMDNFGFLGIGLPIGMAIGVAYGTKLDAEAAKEGRQLDVDLSA